MKKMRFSIMLIILMLSGFGFLYWNLNSKFSPERWRNEESWREEMAADLIEKKTLIGKDRIYVCCLLDCTKISGSKKFKFEDEKWGFIVDFKTDLTGYTITFLVIEFRHDLVVNAYIQ